MTAARDAGSQRRLPRGQRDVPPDPAGPDAARRRAAWSSATRPATCRTRCTGGDNELVTSDWREPPDPDPESSLTGTLYESNPADAAFVVVRPDAWLLRGTGAGARYVRCAGLVGIEYDRVNPGWPVPRPIEILSHSPLTCRGVRSYADSAYYTHPGGPGCSAPGPCAGSGPSTATPGTASDRRTAPVHPAGDRQRPAGLRRRPGRGPLPGPRQPARHARMARGPDRGAARPLVMGLAALADVSRETLVG